MSIAEVVQEGSGTPSARLAELQERAREMSAYFYKGFGNTIGGIIDYALIYIMRPNMETRIQAAYSDLSTIEQFYAALPFSFLEGRQDFTPFFAVRDLLPKIRPALDQVRQNRSMDSYEALKEVIILTVDTGREYMKTFLEVLQAIRSFPEGKDFGKSLPANVRPYWDSIIELEELRINK